MNIRFLEPAIRELDETISFFEHEQEGLGDTFVTDVTHALNSIAAFPNAWHPLSPRTRRCRLRRFPYGLIYQIRENELLIIAVAHLHRNPDYWKNRVA